MRICTFLLIGPQKMMHTVSYLAKCTSKNFSFQAANIGTGILSLLENQHMATKRYRMDLDQQEKAIVLNKLFMQEKWTG